MCIVEPHLNRVSCSSRLLTWLPVHPSAGSCCGRAGSCDGRCRKAEPQLCVELLMLPGCSTGAEPVCRGADTDFLAVHAKGSVEQPGQDCLDYPVPESGYENSFKATQVMVLPACCCCPLSCPSAEEGTAASSSTSGVVAVH